MGVEFRSRRVIFVFRGVLMCLVGWIVTGGITCGGDFACFSTTSVCG